MSWRDCNLIIILPALVTLAYLMDKAEVWLRAKLQRPFCVAARRRAGHLKGLTLHHFRRKRADNPFHCPSGRGR